MTDKLQQVVNILNTHPPNCTYRHHVDILIALLHVYTLEHGWRCIGLNEHKLDKNNNNC